LAVREEANQPIVDIVRQRKSRGFMEESGVADGVEGLAEIEGQDMDIRAFFQAVRYMFEKTSYGSSSGSLGAEGKLVMEGERGREKGGSKGRVEILTHHQFFQGSRKNSRQGDGTVVRATLRRRGFRNRYNNRGVPLGRDNRRGEGEAEKVGSGGRDERSRKLKKPGREEVWPRRGGL